MSEPLKNARHELFAEYVAKGASGVQAYRDVYGDVKTAVSAASRLLSKDNVAARVDDLRKKFAEEREDLWVKACDSMAKTLDDHLRGRQDEKGPSGMAIAASKVVDILAKVQGRYAPKKVEHQGDLSSVVQAAEKAGPPAGWREEVERIRKVKAAAAEADSDVAAN